MRPSQACSHWAEPSLACLGAVMPQSPDGKRQDKNAQRLPRCTPEAAYSVSRVVGAERPLPHSCSEGPRCMYCCTRTTCMCTFRTVPHVNGCLLCACPCTSPVSSVLPSFLNDMEKDDRSKEDQKGFPRVKPRHAGSTSLMSSIARRFRRSRSLPDRARKAAPLPARHSRRARAKRASSSG